MTVLLWWLIPLGATLLALAWVAVRSRPSRPVDAEQGMADLERFREAMSKPLPRAPRRRLDVEGDDIEYGTPGAFDDRPTDDVYDHRDGGPAAHRRSA